jgi:hypothetical protein
VISEAYPGLDFSREELADVMRRTYGEIAAFIATPAFRAVYDELLSLPAAERTAFVSDVLLRPEALAERGVVVPEGILIQASAFGDRRPTLFAVKKFLPTKYHDAWENVNWTFDNKFEDHEVTRDPDEAWRPPLPVALQNALMERGVDLEEAPVELGVNHDVFCPPAVQLTE